MTTLVTGGGGFLGGVIVKMLRERNEQVRSFSRAAYPSLAALGVMQVQGDLSDRDAVLQAAEGCDCVFHVAAKAGIWGNYEDFYRANVTGTENILAACHGHGISKLVYTSSPSVIFDGSDVEGGDETLPYPSHYEAFYPQTKSMAEQQVLAANGSHLATVALRPHLIWGPDDNHLVPRIIAKGKSGRLRKIGNRSCLVDTVYVDNAAKAHIQAADLLTPGSPLSGKAYFISNGEPIPLWDMVNKILEAGGIPPVRKSISPQVAYIAGSICEFLWKLLKLTGEPPMTRFLAKELATAHWFKIDAARRDFGYQPEVTLDDGIRQLKLWLTR